MITEYSTIKELADSARQDGMSAFGEAGFARLCLEFEERINSDYDKALAILAAGQDAKEINLALVWLDGKGYSLLTVERLAAILYKIRERH
ncbi:MAG: hypothetical protein JWP00_4331 [Chloroflexi bacterium]|jgi:L-alanine-DL-glutamate epimerase-like enolase superfamily enzyme|nr:hypothetical protein [Chloroflexota bacterium]